MAIDLIAWPHDSAPVEEVIADRRANALGKLIAQSQLQGGKDGELVGAALADVRRLREKASGKGAQSRRNQRARTGLVDEALDIDDLVGCAQRDLARDLDGEAVALDGKPAAELAS